MSYPPYKAKETVKTGTAGLIIGILLAICFPPITWIIAYFLYKKYVRENNLSDARGIKIGTLVTIPIALLFSLFVFSLLAAILVPNFVRARAQGQLTACKSNQKNIALAVEMWQKDHKGQCPQKLSDLVGGENGGYLKRIPTCPSAEKDTYSVSYKSSADGKHFEFCCSGENHAMLDIPPNKPAFNSDKGLIEE